MATEELLRWQEPGLSSTDICRFKATYDEFGETPELPDHWPECTPPLLVFLKKRPIFLPPDWGFAVKSTISGKTLGYAITPGGKGYFHKKDMEEKEGLDTTIEYPPMDGLSRPIYWVGPPENVPMERVIFDRNELEAPPHWPEEVRPDTRRRIHWLPEEIGQGIKETSSGLTLQCYIMASGKRYFHRKDIERDLGYPLEDVHLELNGRGDPILDNEKNNRRLEGYWTLTPPEEQDSEDPHPKPATPPAKRQKVEEAPVAPPSKPPANDQVDSEYVMERKGDCWHVVPEDVLYVDISKMGVELEKAGWSRSEDSSDMDPAKFSKSGSGTLMLSSGGTLDIRGVESEAQAAEVARQYVAEWLLVGS